MRKRRQPGDDVLGDGEANEGGTCMAPTIATSTTVTQVQRYTRFSQTVRSSRNQYPQNISHRPICTGGSTPKTRGASSEREPTQVV